MFKNPTQIYYNIFRLNKKTLNINIYYTIIKQIDFLIKPFGAS